MITLYSNGLTSVWHILGVGAIGMRWARKLKQAGEPVTLILRDEAKLREFVDAGSGIRYLSHVGEEFIPFPATSLNDPALRIENLLLCTKSYSLAAAYEAVVQKVVAGANLVLLCNGYGVQQRLGADASAFRVWAASTTSGANSAAPFHLTLAGDGRTELGPLNNLAKESVHPLLNLPRHTKSADIEATLWRKVAVNACINPITALYELKNGEVLNHPNAYERMESVAAEIEELAIALDKPLFEKSLLKVAEDVCRTTAENLSSMLQDRQNRRASEIEQITGALLELASETSLTLPNNQRLLHEIRAIEAETLSPSNLGGK